MPVAEGNDALVSIAAGLNQVEVSDASVGPDYELTRNRFEWRAK